MRMPEAKAIDKFVAQAFSGESQTLKVQLDHVSKELIGNKPLAEWLVFNSTGFIQAAVNEGLGATFANAVLTGILLGIHIADIETANRLEEIHGR